MNIKQISIDLELRNGQNSKNGKLNGFAYVESGFLSGKIVPNCEFSLSEQVIITAFSFTGCPISARTEQPELNPWRLTNGAYNSIRKLNSTQFIVNSELSSSSFNDSIHMKLNLDIRGILPDLTAITKPFQERIKQKEIGKLIGHFHLNFCTQEGEEIEASAISEYNLNINQNVSTIWRNILILNSGSENNFIQTEQIDLFGEKLKADADLLDKLKLNYI